MKGRSALTWRRRTAGDDTPTRTTSLRRRLVVSIVTMLLIVLAALGILVHTVLGDRLHSELRQRVQERAGYATVLAGRGLGAQQLADELTGQGITASVSTNGGTPVIGRDQPPGPPPGSTGTAGAGFGGPPLERPNRRSIGSVDTSAIAVQTHGEEVFAEVKVGNSDLLLTASSVELDRTLNVLRNIELGAGAVTLLVIGLVTLLIVRRAFVPLARMTSLAERIQGGARGRRLNPSHPKTDLGRTATAMDGMLDALESAEAKAQQAEARMRQFLADASHDLRTPLALVIASAERELRAVELIREAQRAARLVDDLMLMARLDDVDAATQLRHEPVDLQRLTSDVVDRSRLTMRGRTLELSGVGSTLVLGDPDRLTQVLVNLLDNARTATTTDGTIRVRVDAGPEYVGVTVTDDGPGVPPAERERIFDRFVRLDPARNGTGSGLGLPIARAIARAHGGDLTCTDARGGTDGGADASGGSFTLRLPLAPGPVRSDSPHQSADLVVAS